MRDAAADTGILALSRFSISISNIVLLPILTKGLGSVGYGIWVQAWVLLPLLASVLDLGLPSAMLRFFLQKDRVEYTKDFYRIVAVVGTLACGAGALFWFGAPLIPASLFDGSERVVRLVALLLPIWVLGMLYHSLLQALRRMRDYGIAIVVQNALELGLAGIFIVAGWGIEGALGAILLVRSLLLIVLAAYATRFLSAPAVRGGRITPYLAFGLPLVPMNVSSWAVSYIDRFILAIMMGTAAVGNYDSAYTIGRSVPFLMASVMGMGLLPSLSSMYDHGDREQVRQTCTFMIKALLAICIPFTVGGALLARPLLSVLTTEEMALAGARVLPLVAIALTIHGCKVVVSQAFYLEKRTKAVGWTYSLAAVANAALTVLLVPVWGIEGAAVATIAAYGLDLAVTLLLATRSLLPRPGASAIARIALATSAMAGAVLAALRATPSELVLPLAVGMLTYLACLRVFSVLSPDERALLGSLLPWHAGPPSPKSPIAIFGSLLEREDECVANKVRRINAFLEADIYSASHDVGFRLSRREGRYTLINAGHYLNKHPVFGHLNKAWGYGAFKARERAYKVVILSGGIDSPFLDFLDPRKCVPYVTGMSRSEASLARARRIAPQLRGAIVETETLATLLSSLGLPRERIFVIQPVIDPAHLVPLPPPDDDGMFHILFASSPLKTPARPKRYESKGVPLLLEAYALLVCDIPAHLTLLWRQDYHGRLEKDLAALGIEGVVTVVNTNVDIIPYYRSHHCLVIPYAELEGGPELPLSALEALAHARPVVATPIGDMAPLIREHGCGTVSGDMTPQALSEALRACWNTYPACQAHAHACAGTLLDEEEDKYIRLKAFLLSQ